jgi:hypothetical protein
MNIKRILVTAAIGIVVAGAAGFGGYSIGLKTGQTQTANTRAAFLASRGQNGAAGQTGGANNANFAMGQVKTIDGNTVQLSTANEVLTVKLTDKTTIQKTGTGTVADIKTGERITVQGARGTDGAMTADRVQIGGGIGGPNGAPNAAPGTAAQAPQGASQGNAAPPAPSN